MNDYTDLLLAMGAMVIYSILLLNTNTSLLRSDVMQVETELEYTAISLANSVIDDIRVKPFNDIDTESPTYGQILTGSIIPGNAAYDLEDFVEVTWTENTAYGTYDLKLEIQYVQRDSPDNTVLVPTDYQRMDVTVSSQYLTNEIKLSYIRSRY